MGTGWLVHFDAYLHRGPLMHAFYQTPCASSTVHPRGRSGWWARAGARGGTRGDAARAAGITQEGCSVA